MSGTSWFETRRMPLVSLLQQRQKGTQLLLDKAPAGSAQAARLTEEVTRLGGLIGRRTADPAFSVVVRHIGSVEDPNAHELLEAEEMRAYELSRIRLRKVISDAGGTPDEATLSAFMASDVEWRKQESVLAKKWIEAGVVDGAAEYQRLAQLGGSALLQDAVAEVKFWQNVEFSQGEG